MQFRGWEEGSLQSRVWGGVTAVQGTGVDNGSSKNIVALHILLGRPWAPHAGLLRNTRQGTVIGGHQHAACARMKRWPGLK